MELPQNISFKAKEYEMLNLLRQGDKNAFEEIFKAYWKEMYKQAYSKLRNKEAAEEIVQDIFTSLWVKREELLITNLQYYLSASVKNKVLNYVRSQIVHEKYWDYYKKYLVGPNDVTEEIIYYNDLKEAVEKGTSFLSKKGKTIFQLNRIDGYSVPEIAKQLNLSEKTIEYHIARALKELRVHLRDYLVPILILVYTTGL
ncbi:MAG: RNA polymerase sigma-70 factor [Cyclobacteriaceae bacterium]|nr:RNA polymerase sigma-70 factor [Cyclobacteriaceae bacterium]